MSPKINTDPKKVEDKKKAINWGEDDNFSPLFRQSIVLIGPVILTLCGGMVSGFSAIALPQLSEKNSTISIDENEASWIASIMVLPMPIGCALGGVLMERYGRKAAHQIICLPFIAGWIIIWLSTNTVTLLVGRFLSGLCTGTLVPVSSVYMSEISEPRYRGLLLATLSLALALGFLIVHAMGIFLTWKTIALASALVPFLVGLVMCPLPESPSWLVRKGRTEEATISFFWCRGYSVEAKEEFKTILENHLKTKDNQRPTKEVLKGLISKEFLKPFCILVVFFITVEWCGVDAIPFYTITFIEDSVGNGIDTYSAMLIIDAIRVVVSGAACIVTKFCGRRPLVLTSGFGTAASLLFLSGFMYASKYFPQLERMSAVPFMCLVLYMVFVTIGLGAICWIITGELFPLSMRSYGSAAVNTIGFLLFFSVVKTVPAMFRFLGTSGTFLVYGCVALVGTAILGFILPESKDKTLQEIEDDFKSSTPKNPS